MLDNLKKPACGFKQDGLVFAFYAKSNELVNFIEKIRPSMFMIKSNGMNKLMYNSVFAETTISQSQVLSPWPSSN